MITILSPAKSMNFEFELNGHSCSTPELINEADYLANKLRSFSQKKVGKLMSLSDNLTELNYNRYQQWEVPHGDRSRPAMLAFTGDVYRGLAADTFTPEDLDFAQDHIRILSGLYGLLRPMDRILPYRLEMGTSWAVTPSKKNLYKYWGGKITDTLNEAIKNSGSEILVNLASNEYYKAIQPKNIAGEILTCSFKDKKKGQYNVIMTYAKQARGLMARYIVSNRIEKKQDLKDFDLDGYQFNPSLSLDDEYVFTRE